MNKEAKTISNYLKSVVCATCLSSNRRFITDETLGLALFKFPTFISLNLKEDKVCWECHAIIRKLWAFHLQALEAKNTLTKILAEHKGTIASMSKLRRSQVFAQNTNSNPVPMQFMKQDKSPDFTQESPIIQYISMSSHNNPSMIKPVINVKEELITPNLTKLKNKTVAPFDPNSVSIVPKIVKISSCKERDPNVNLMPFKVYSGHQIEQEINNQICDDYDSLDSDMSCDSKDFDTQIKEHKISKETIKISKETNRNVENKAVKLENTNIPIIDLRHINIATTKADNHLSNADIVTSKCIPKVLQSEKKGTGKCRRIRNNKRIYETDIVIYNNTLEKDLFTEEEIRQLYETDRSDEFYQRFKFKCDKCVFGFEDEGLYKAHLYRHQESYGKEVCRICEQRFKDAESRELHYKTHFKAYYCTLCLYASRCVQAVAAHSLKVHETPALYRCDKCPADYHEQEELRRHTKLAHASAHECKQCGKTFNVKYKLKKHQLVHDEMQMHECVVCHKELRGKNGLRIHMKNSHSSKDESFYCKPCDRFFASLLSLQIHLKYNRSHANAQYQCDYCGKKFMSKFYIRKHISTYHMGISDFKCKQCGKLFTTASSLKRHMYLVHADKDLQEKRKQRKRHMCCECGKTYSTPVTLKHHLTVHSGEKPFQCRYCPWKFAQKSTLLTHHKYKHKDIPVLFKDL